MKKLGKSFSFLTKIMLVVGLLISNLSSLSVVFAYEATGAIEIAVINDKLNIKYTDELAEEVENVNVNVYENYTYLDNTSYYVDELATEPGKLSTYSLTSEELIVLEGLELESILSSIIFDGLYEVKVEITDTNDEIIDSAVYSENVEHDSGLAFKLFDEVGNEIIASENNVYSIMKDNSKINVVAQILAGGLKPTDMFSYNDEDYMGVDLLELEFSSEFDFSGHLYGEYTLPIEVKLLNSNLEEVIYTDNIEVLYESYAKNTLLLNEGIEELGLSETYEFNGDTKDGVLTVLLNSNITNTVLDLYNLMNLVVSEDDVISYVISNNEYEDILATYNDTLGVSLEDYLNTILLDDNTVLSLMNEGLTITYKVVMVGDTNGDNILTDEDLLGLVDQVIGLDETNLSKSDLNSDEEVNTLDVMYLDQVVKTGMWEVALEEVEAVVDASLVLNGSDVVSGDEFTVDYVLSVKDYAVNGFAGLFNYDEAMLELVSVEVANDFVGNINDGKFLYLVDESLVGTEVTSETGEIVFEAVDYVVLTATFKALKSGESEVTINEIEYFDQNKYLVVDSMVEPVTVVVNASDNNNLSSLIVAGQTIELVEDVLDYEITVSNDVTVADVEAIVSNVAANITSIVAPEELIEGANTITITITAENGDVKVYTITVNREKAVEEENTTTQMNYTNNYYETSGVEDSNKEEVIIDAEEDEDDEEVEVEEESNISKIIIIILILLVIAGLIYLIFKDEDDEETRRTNKEINKLKKEKEEVEVKVEKTSEKPINKSNNKTNSNNKKNNRK